MSQGTNFAWPVTSVDKGDYEAFEKWFDEHSEMLQENQLVIWGAGIRGTEFAIFLKKRNFKNIIFVDSNKQKWGGYIDEFSIISPTELEQQRGTVPRKILISTENSAQIEKELGKIGYCKEKDFFLIRTFLYEKYLEEFQRNCENKYLIMGDCEFSTISISDTDYRTLSDMIKQRCGEKTTKILAMHGMGLRAYYNILQAQLEKNMKPKTLLVMVNFDTLTGMQHLLPRSQHAELIQMIYDISKKDNKELEEYVHLVWERSKNLQTEFFTNNQGLEGNEAKIKNYIRLNYMYKLNPEIEGIQYLKKILDVALINGINVIPFIPPVNYELAEKLFGCKFKDRYEKNVEILKNIIQVKNAKLLDLSYLLSSDMFAEPSTPDETANDIGRKMIMEAICSEMIEKKI